MYHIRTRRKSVAEPRLRLFLIAAGATILLSLFCSCASEDNPVAPDLGPQPPQHPVLVSSYITDSYMMPTVYWQDSRTKVDFYRVYCAGENDSFHIIRDSILPVSPIPSLSSREASRVVCGGGDPGTGSPNNPVTTPFYYYSSGWNSFYVTTVVDGIESAPSQMITFRGDSVFPPQVLTNLRPEKYDTVRAETLTFSWDAAAPATGYFVHLWRIDNDTLRTSVWQYRTLQTRAKPFETSGITYLVDSTHQLQSGLYRLSVCGIDGNGYGFIRANTTFNVVK